MRRIILLYHFIVFIVSIVINFVYFYEKAYRIELLILSQLICLVGLYYTFKFLLNYKTILLSAAKFLFLFNLIQVFTFSFSGITYKSIYGSQIFLIIRKYGLNEDLILKAEFNIYMNQFYFNYDSSEIFFMGFNLLQFIFCIYFISMLISKKNGKYS